WVDRESLSAVPVAYRSAARRGRARRHIRDHDSVLVPKLGAAAACVERVAALVHQPVMAPTQQDQVVEPRRAAAAPMPDMVRIDEARPVTAREAAAAITCSERAAQRRPDRAALPA